VGRRGRPRFGRAERRAVCDRADRDRKSAQLEQREVLPEQRPTECGAGDRRGETEKRWRGLGQAPDAAEPEHEGEGGPDQAEIREPGDVASGEGWGSALEDDGQGYEHQATDHELPTRGGETVRRSR
jgi:hypothetical protein